MYVSIYIYICILQRVLKINTYINVKTGAWRQDQIGLYKAQVCIQALVDRVKTYQAVEVSGQVLLCVLGYVSSMMHTSVYALREGMSCYQVSVE
jgi:hypothetical protein